MFKPDLEKAEEPEIKLPTSVGSQKKQENSRKTSTSASLTRLKPLTVWITTHFGKYLKRWEYQTTWPASWEMCMQVKKQQFELDMEQQTGSKFGKAVCQGLILSPCLFNLYEEYIMQNARVNEGQAAIKIAWRIPWREEPGGLQSVGSQRVEQDWSDLACMPAAWCGQIFFLKEKTTIIL